MNKKVLIVVLCAILLSVQAIFAQQKNSIGMELRMIPKGSFYMGSDGLGENYDEAPMHKVTISKSFLMGATEDLQLFIFIKTVFFYKFDNIIFF